MNLSQNTQVILLLTGYFNSSSSSSIKPLAISEWSRVAEYLKNKEVQPSRLLEGDFLQLLDDFSDKKITLDRISSLLKRGTAMAVALEKWSRASIWVISRADKEYPDRLKKKLGQKSPPILYGCGNKALLNKGGIGVVGSRNVPQIDLEYTRQLGAKAAKSGFSIISGGAKGVDQAAMFAALEVDGTVIGIMADSLFRACSSRQYRHHIMNNNLVLITPFYPEAGFNAGNAMQRNKYIYCLSDTVVAVHSGKPEGSKKGGGTWTGALENLTNGWVKLWTKQTDDERAGNHLIVEKGGSWLSADIQQVDIDNMLQAHNPQFKNHQAKSASEDLFSKPEMSYIKPKAEVEEAVKKVSPSGTDSTPETETAESKTKKLTENLINESENSQHITSGELTTIPKTFYDYFLIVAKPLLQEKKSLNDLVTSLEVNKTQLNVWLKKAIEEKHIKKLTKPDRYQWNSDSGKQGSLL